MREWISKNILGLTKAPEVKEIDIKNILHKNQSILLDTSTNMPICRWLSPITSWDEYKDQATIEVRTFTNPWSNFEEYGTEKFTKPGLQAIEDEEVMFISDTRQKIDGSIEANLELITEMTKLAVSSKKKFIIYLNNKDMHTRDGERYAFHVINSIAVSLGSMNLFKKYKCPLVCIDLIEEHASDRVLHDINVITDLTPTIINHQMRDTPSFNKLKANLHIVEHSIFKKHLRSNAEVILSDNTRAIIKDHPKSLKLREWDYKGYQFDQTPRVTELPKQVNNFVDGFFNLGTLDLEGDFK